MYKTMEEILAAVASGRITPDEAEDLIAQLEEHKDPMDEGEPAPSSASAEETIEAEVIDQEDIPEDPSRRIDLFDRLFRGRTGEDIEQDITSLEPGEVIRGNVYGNVLCDIPSGVLFKRDLQGNVDGNVCEGAKICGDLEGDINGSLKGSINGDMNGSITGSFTETAALGGDMEGSISGDLAGRIGGDMDGRILGNLTETGKICGDMSGTIGRDLRGAIAGDMSGDIGGVISPTGKIGGDMYGKVLGDMFGHICGDCAEICGDVYGRIDGDVKIIRGSIMAGAVIGGGVRALYGANHGKVHGDVRQRKSE